MAFLEFVLIYTPTVVVQPQLNVICLGMGKEKMIQVKIFYITLQTTPSHQWIPLRKGHPDVNLFSDVLLDFTSFFDDLWCQGQITQATCGVARKDIYMTQSVVLVWTLFRIFFFDPSNVNYF